MMFAPYGVTYNGARCLAAVGPGSPRVLVDILWQDIDRDALIDLTPLRRSVRVGTTQQGRWYGFDFGGRPAVAERHGKQLWWVELDTGRVHRDWTEDLPSDWEYWLMVPESTADVRVELDEALAERDEALAEAEAARAELGALRVTAARRISELSSELTAARRETI